MKPVEIFSSNLCPYCRLAKRLLAENGVSFEERKIVLIAGFKLPTANFKEMKRRSGGQTTVPQIFVDGAHYGDEDTLKADLQFGRFESVFNR